MTQSTGHSVRVAAYVDGFNLYNGMHAARGRRGLWLDMESLLGHFLGPNQQLVALHYFTALVNGPGRAAQQVYLNAVEAHGAVTHTHVGHFQEKHPTCRSCGYTWVTYEEKESDVSLAVQLVEDAARDVFDQAMIVSADRDMKPAVESVRRIAPAKRLIAVFPPHRVGHSLAQVVDATLQIFDRLPERHLLPDVVTATSGAQLSRPERWR